MKCQNLIVLSLEQVANLVNADSSYSYTPAVSSIYPKSTELGMYWMSWIGPACESAVL